MIITIDNTKELKALYSEINTEFEKMMNDKGLNEMDIFDEYYNETDEDGFSKHVTCDEIWCMIDYVYERVGTYPIEISHNGNVIRMTYYNIDYIKMLFVNLLWMCWELEKPISLNGEDIHEINKLIEF